MVLIPPSKIAFASAAVRTRSAEAAAVEVLTKAISESDPASIPRGTKLGYVITSGRTGCRGDRVLHLQHPRTYQPLVATVSPGSR